MQNKFGDTALCIASHHGHIKCAIALLKHGADVNYQRKVRLLYVELELYRAHTPRALQRRCRCEQPVDDLYLHKLLCQVVRMSREHIIIVGSVHRRGQQNAVFGTLVGLAKRFEAY